MKTPCTLLAALVVLASCRPPEKKSAAAPARRLNLVLVTIDTLRPDRLGCYGYSRIETPNLDTLAQKGTLFENAVASAPLTAPSHASILTGTYPTVHKVRDTGAFVLQGSNTTLAEILQEQGWDTAAFVGASVLKRRFGFSQGFAVYDDQMEGRERRAADVVDRAVRWIEAQSGKPFFVWVHVFDPHLPYDPPSPFREKYRGRPYDGEVAYADQQLGRLFEAVSKKQNTLVAVLSDHGESFSEHGEYAHGVFVYDTTLRIAFLIAGPGVPAGLRVKPQARTIDLLPTVVELMGIPAPRGVQGTSLVPAFNGKEGAADTYVETLFPKLNMGWSELRGVRTNRWKYIRAPKPELYDLVQDPGESNNVIASHAAEARALEARLDAIAGKGTETVETAPVDQRTLAQLKSLGYLGGSPQGKYVLSGQGVDPKDRTGVLKLLHFAVYADPSPPLPRRIAMLREALQEDRANPALYSNLGDLYKDAGLHADEMRLYQEAIRQGIRAAWLFSRLGSLYLRQGNKDEAINYFERAAQLDPSDYASLQNLAATYRETGRIADAERVCEWILKSGEEYAPAYNELGMAAFQKGDRAQALTYFEKAARLDPTYQLNLGRLYKMIGDNARARASFEAFLAARGSSPEYRQIVPEVRRELAAIP